MKNLCGKMRKVNEPYEVWRNADGWEWRVLKKYQSEEQEAKNQFARWMCAVKSPFTSPGYDMGDTYIRDIADMNAELVWTSHGPMEIEMAKW